MKNLERCIDHTLLRPDSTSEDIKKLCLEASAHEFCTVFVLPCWVSLACRLLKNTNVKVGSVSGFPLGAALPDIKAAEAARLLDDGVAEIDMVMQIGAAKEANWQFVQKDIEMVVSASEDLIEAGANRTGTSCGTQLMQTSTIY